MEGRKITHPHVRGPARQFAAVGFAKFISTLGNAMGVAPTTSSRSTPS